MGDGTGRHRLPGAVLSWTILRVHPLLERGGEATGSQGLRVALPMLPAPLPAVRRALHSGPASLPVLLHGAGSSLLPSLVELGDAVHDSGQVHG